MSTSSSARAEMRFDVLPSQSLISGRDFAVVVRGAAPGGTLRLNFSAVDRFGAIWSSKNDFLVGADGTVDPGRQSPLVGTYAGIDNLGPFWSMVPGRERLAPWGFGSTRTNLQDFFSGTGVTRTVKLSARTRMEVAPPMRFAGAQGDDTAFEAFVGEAVWIDEHGEDFVWVRSGWDQLGGRGGARRRCGCAARRDCVSIRVPRSTYPAPVRAHPGSGGRGRSRAAPWLR